METFRQKQTERLSSDKQFACINKKPPREVAVKTGNYINAMKLFESPLKSDRA
jgi:hypothetical protein